MPRESQRERERKNEKEKERVRIGESRVMCHTHITDTHDWTHVRRNNEPCLEYECVMSHI